MKRFQLAGALLFFALLWVLVMGALFGGGRGSSSKPASDGSRALIKYVDKSSFYQDDGGEISLRLDIHNPQGEPLRGLVQDKVQVSEHGTPGTIKDFKGPGTQPLNVILVIDVSGSMGSENKMQGAIQAASAAVEELQVGRDALGLISFDNRFDVLHSLSRLTPQTKIACQQSVRGLRPRGGTVIGAPTIAALDMFLQTSPKGPKLLMVMTDGENKGLSEFVEMIAGKSEETGVPVFTISFGNLENPLAVNVLTELAGKCKGQYFHAPSGEQLAEIYRSQMQELSEEFTIVYESPYPRADGLPRNVVVQIDSPSGKLMATTNYQIGSLVDSGAVRPQASGSASVASGALSAMSKFLTFAFLLVLLGLALVAPQFWAPLRLALTGKEAVAGASVASTPSPTPAPSPAAVAPPPPPPPGGAAAARPAVGALASQPSSPVAGRSAAAPKPTTAKPVSQPTGGGMASPPPPPPRSPPKTPPKSPPSPGPTSGKTGVKKVRPIPPPPPPPGGGSKSP